MKKSAFILILMTLVKVTNGQQINLKDSALEADYIACINCVYLLKDQTMEGAVVRNNSSSVVSQFNDPESGTFTDTRDGQTYKWVKIGDQVWMAENLNYVSKKSWCYNDDETFCQQYGRLYTWNAAMTGASSSSSNPSGVQGACPPGWHLPSESEWTKLINYIVSNYHVTNEKDDLTGVGNKLKSCRQISSPLGQNCSVSEHPRWEQPTIRNHFGTDELRFSALPGGSRGFRSFPWGSAGGSSNGIGLFGIWWSSTLKSNKPLNYAIIYGAGDVQSSYTEKRFSHSVRCVKDTDNLTF